MYFTNFIRPVKSVLLVACLHACAENNLNMLDQPPQASVQHAETNLQSHSSFQETTEFIDTAAHPSHHDVPTLAVADGMSLVSTTAPHASSVQEMSTTHQAPSKQDADPSTWKTLIPQHQLQGKTRGIRTLTLEGHAEKSLRAVVHMNNGDLVKIPHHDIAALPQHIDQEKLECALEQGLLPFLGQHADGSYRLSFQVKGLGGMHRRFGKQIGNSLSSMQRQLQTQLLGGCIPHRRVPSFSPAAPMLQSHTAPQACQFTLPGVRSPLLSSYSVAPQRGFSTLSSPKRLLAKKRNKAVIEGPRKLVSFDWALKYLLKNKVTYDVVEGFLSELLRKDVKILKLLDAESNKTHKDDKYNRVDVLVETREKEQIIIEFQASEEGDYLSRLWYGKSKTLVEGIKAGQGYLQIPKVISVNIIFFDLGIGKKCVHRCKADYFSIDDDGDDIEKLEFGLLEKKAYGNDKQFPADVLPESYIINVPRFNEKTMKVDVKRRFNEWLYFLKTESIKPDFKAQGLERAVEVLDVLKLSHEDRREYEIYQKALSSKESQLTTAMDKGKVKGKAEGEAKKEREMILGMHEGKMPIEEIAKWSKLTVSEVEKILADHPKNDK